MDARSITEVLKEHTPELLGIPGVTGVAEGALDDGTACIVVYVETVPADARVPSTLAGHPVDIRPSGPLTAR